MQRASKELSSKLIPGGDHHAETCQPPQFQPARHPFLPSLISPYNPLMQKWIRPAPSADKVQDRTPGLGTGVDFNEADPLLVVDNLYQSAAMPRHSEGR